MKSPEGVEQLAKDLAAMCFDKFGVKSSVDAQVTVSNIPDVCVCVCAFGVLL